MFPGDLKQITRKHEQGIGPVGVKAMSGPVSPCSGWKPRSAARLDTLCVAPGGPRIILTFGRTEPVGRSVAASPVESFGLRLTSASTSAIQERSFQPGGFRLRFRDQRCRPVAGLFGVEETVSGSATRSIGNGPGMPSRVPSAVRSPGCSGKFDEPSEASDTVSNVLCRKHFEPSAYFHAG
jgi:hypothetical protein